MQRSNQITSPRLGRRQFLAGMAGGGAAIALRPSLAGATPAAGARGDAIVMLYLRGGADGLSLVAPWQMASYQSIRPTIRVKDASEFGDPVGVAGLPLQSGGNVGAFDLSNTFAMHPGMQSLYDGAWADGNLAIVHAAGMPVVESATRSHFEAQRNMEIGSASLSVHDGFLNRYLAAVGATERIAAVGRGSHLQEMLHGGSPAYSMSSIGGFGVSGFGDNSDAQSVFSQWYQPGSPVGTVGANTLSALSAIDEVDWSDAALQPQNGASYSNSGLGRDLREVAALLRGDVGLQAACIDVGGWDTHEGMGRPEDGDSYFRGRATDLANSLQAFYTDLGSAMSEVTVMVISEFGRTIDENGNGGVDHGRGGLVMVMGGGVNGGVHGDFVDSIVDGPEDDLAVVNDYRRVAAEVLTVRGGAADPSGLFPTWTPTSYLGLCQPG